MYICIKDGLMDNRMTGHMYMLHEIIIPYHFFCVCWSFKAQLTYWGHVEHGQFTYPHLGLVFYAVNQYCVHSITRNWQLPFLHQQKGENDRRKYFMINLQECCWPGGVEPATFWSPVRCASNWAPRLAILHHCHVNRYKYDRNHTDLAIN